MALTTYEQLFALYNDPTGLTYSVHTFIRADQVGNINAAITNNATTSVQVNTSPSGASTKSNIEVGDILQIADEDMLVESLGAGGQVGVQREYAGTAFQSPGYPAGTGTWIWKDFTDRVENQHGIAAISSLERRFEYALNTYGTTAGSVKALNTDRFWDDLSLIPIGLSSFRHRWIRFYIRAWRGGVAVDHRAIATLLIEDVTTDESDYATLKLMGIGSLLRNKAEASSTRQGREWYTYTPTSLVVEALLASVEGLRTTGTGALAGLPLHWRRSLSAAASRTIALPASTYAISAHGKVTDFGKPSSTADFLARNVGVPGGSMAGGYASAMAWDPQVTGANTVTGDPATVGRLYVGVGPDIWEFDPETREGKVAISNAGSGKRIRRLWYCALDTATATKPKIYGAAWGDYASTVADQAYAERAVAAILFSWNGGAALTNSTSIANFWPGTHFFRDGAAVSFGAGGVGAQPSMGIGNATIASTESIPLPFAQFIYSHSDTAWSSANSSVIFSKRSSLTAGNTDRTKADGILDQGIELMPGVGYPSDGYGAAAAAVNLKGFDVVHFNNTDRMNCRFTLGQQGACCLYSTNTARNNAADTGAIVYCDINTTTGIISVNSWEPVSGTGVVGIKVCATKEEQPCAMAGNGDQACANAQHILFVGTMLWSESGNSRGKIYKYIDLGTETTYYDGNADAVKYYSPLWLAYIHVSSAVNGILTSTYRRDKSGDADQFGYYAGLTSATVTNWSPTYSAASLLHAATWNKFSIDESAFAMDTAGRLVRIVFNATTCAITSVTPQDRGFCPIEGETWSATDQLAIFSSQECYGISSPVWPFGNDIRQGRADGLYILWKLAGELWDTYDLGYFEDKTIEEALGDLAFASNAVWSFDADGRGNFSFTDRVSSASPLFQLGGIQDRISSIARRPGYDEIENPVEITPWTIRSGEIKARVDLSAQSTLSSASEPIDVQSPDNKQKMMQLTCVQAGRIGSARFKVQIEGGTIKTLTTTTYAASAATTTIDVMPLGDAAAGPYLETTAAQLNRKHQIPIGSRIRLPDGTERTISAISTPTDYTMTLTIASWTPSVNIYAGSTVEIYGEVDRQASDYTITTSDPNGTYLLTSSYEWQEIGSGEAWATGCLIRFREPPDDGVDVNYNETAWNFGDRIVIEVPGLEVVANSSAKITAFDADASRQFGKKALTTERGRLPARKCIYVADVRKDANAVPRWIYTINTTLLPFVPLFSVLTAYSPKLIRTAPYTDDVTIRSMRFDLTRGRTVIEAIGSPIA